VASQMLNTLATVHAVLHEMQYRHQTEAEVGAVTVQDFELLRAEKANNRLSASLPASSVDAAFYSCAPPVRRTSSRWIMMISRPRLQTSSPSSRL
jgi:hypothetical protein